jgi:phosphohistidine phosphatase
MNERQSPEPSRIAQACVIPFRRDGDETAFCLITSLKKKCWIFPKGVVDPGETEEETALKEALEEAGLRGRIIGGPLGSYEDYKWGTTLDVTVLLMEVDYCEDQWPEASLREQCWADPAEALRLVAKPDLKRILRSAIERISTGEINLPGT